MHIHSNKATSGYHSMTKDNTPHQADLPLAGTIYETLLLLAFALSEMAITTLTNDLFKIYLLVASPRRNFCDKWDGIA